MNTLPLLLCFSLLIGIGLALDCYKCENCATVEGEEPSTCTRRGTKYCASMSATREHPDGTVDHFMKRNCGKFTCEEMEEGSKDNGITFHSCEVCSEDGCNSGDM